MNHLIRNNHFQTITCDCEATPALQLKAFRQRGDKVEINHYRVNVNRFRARLNVVCITEKLLIDLKCDGWPEVRATLLSTDFLWCNTLTRGNFRHYAITAICHSFCDKRRYIVFIYSLGRIVSRARHEEDGQIFFMWMFLFGRSLQTAVVIWPRGDRPVGAELMKQYYLPFLVLHR